MRKLILFGMTLAAGAMLAGTAGAPIIMPSTVISDTPDGANFGYSITLTNAGDAGDDPIGTFWLSRIPGQDDIATKPISESSPSGWKAVVTHDTTGFDGQAIQWEATSMASAILRERL